MSEKKIVVPKEMQSVAEDELKRQWELKELPEPSKASLSLILEAALRWLSENPIVPTNDWIKMYATGDSNSFNWLRDVIHEWQRRMFLAPPEEVPEGITDLLHPKSVKGATYLHEDDVNAKILEAYRRGKESK